MSKGIVVVFVLVVNLMNPIAEDYVTMTTCVPVIVGMRMTLTEMVLT